MQFYSALSKYRILQSCLKHLENTTDPDDIAVIRLKRAVLLRIAELETAELKSKLGASRPDIDRECD